MSTEHDDPGSVGFKDLPIELALDIADYLDDIDRLCLALTCASLLDVLDGSKTLQRSPIFKATVTFPDEAHYRKSNYRLDKSPRWELLQRLEDSHWRLCYGCFKLHPPREFAEQELCKKLAEDRRLCLAGPLVGVARLCPCIEITFRQKQKLVRTLRTSATRDIEYTILNSVIYMTDGHGRHQCYHSHDVAWGRVTIHCDLDLSAENSNSLIVEAHYNVCENPYPIYVSTLLFCPHRQPWAHINDLDVQHEQYARRHGGVRLMQIRGGIEGKYFEEPLACPWCRTIIYDAWWDRERRTPHEEGDGLLENRYAWTSRRDFGAATRRADHVWYYQTETSYENLAWQEMLELRAEMLRRSWVRPY